jgi:hypothetical protein
MRSSEGRRRRQGPAGASLDFARNRDHDIALKRLEPRAGGPRRSWHLSGVAIDIRPRAVCGSHNTVVDATCRSGRRFARSCGSSVPPRSYCRIGRGAELRCGRRRAGAPQWSGSPARPTNAGGAAGASIVRRLQPRPCRPDRAPRPQPAAQDESESERPIAVDPVVRRHHWRRRTAASIVDLAVAIAESKRARSGPGTTPSTLPPARAALAQCHGCGSRVDCVVVTAR